MGVSRTAQWSIHIVNTFLVWRHITHLLVRHSDFVGLIAYKSNVNWRQGTSVTKNMRINNSGAEDSDMNILSWVSLTYTRVNTMKRRKHVNQGGHLRDFKLRICLNGVGVSLGITSPASCLCKLQLVCRRLQELTPYTSSAWHLQMDYMGFRS